QLVLWVRVLLLLLLVLLVPVVPRDLLSLLYLPEDQLPQAYHLFHHVHLYLEVAQVEDRYFQWLVLKLEYSMCVNYERTLLVIVAEVPNVMAVSSTVTGRSIEVILLVLR
ncbi:MAG: hypothetical protein MJE68_25545, partial [Proteobacteria bacterium]|nr:hypothetical protein [Pseudomonadota bacterium]